MHVCPTHSETSVRSLPLETDSSALGIQLNRVGSSSPRTDRSDNNGVLIEILTWSPELVVNNIEQKNLVNSYFSGVDRGALGLL